MFGKSFGQKNVDFGQQDSQEEQEMVNTLKRIGKWVLIGIAALVIFWLTITYGVLGLRTVIAWSADAVNKAWTGNVPTIPSAPLFQPAPLPKMPVITVSECQFQIQGESSTFTQQWNVPTQHLLANGHILTIVCVPGMDPQIVSDMSPTPTLPVVPIPQGTRDSEGLSRPPTNGGCTSQAVQLGPWANNGSPESFTIDASQGVTHASLWFPGLSPAETEYSLILTGGQYQFNAGGTAWQYIGCNDVSFADQDAVEHGARRRNAGKITIQVTYDQLKGLYPNNVR